MHSKAVRKLLAAIVFIILKCIIFTKLDLSCAGYGVLLAAEECSDTLITHPLHTPLHVDLRGQLILIMFRGSM